MNRPASVLLALIGVVAVVVAACGGGAEPTSTPRPAPTATAIPSALTPTAAPLPAVTPTSPLPEPQYGGILQARDSADWPNWDTYHAFGGFSTVFTMQLLSNLVRVKKDSGSVIEGDVAESWEVSGDGKTYTFKLRRGIVWHDGQPLTSADVVYNLQRAKSPDFTFNQTRVQAIATMETPDSHTVKVILKGVSNSFLPNIAGPFVLMYPAHITNMAKWQEAAVGSGAFVLKEYKKELSRFVAKNPNYYLKDGAGRSLPYLDGIFYHIILDKTLALAAFRTGRIHCGCAYDQDYLTEGEEELRRDIPGVKLGIGYNARHILLFNLQRPPFNNLLFRQALAIGFDKEAVARTYRAGKNYRPATPLFPPELGGQWGLPKEEMIKIPGYNPNRSVDLEIAQRKFKESGINPKDIPMNLISNPYFGFEGELMASVLSQLGVKAASTSPAGAEVANRRRTGDFDMIHVGVGVSIDDPFDQYCDYLISDGLLNSGKYKNDRVDQLCGEQDRELDVAKRRATLWEVQRIHLTDFPDVPFLWQGNMNGTRPEVFNYHVPVFSVHAAYRLDDVWLKR